MEVIAADGYQLLRHAADGAMCRVYEARSLHTGQTVALKILHELWCGHKELVTRFENEASVLRNIRHPHLILLLDSGRLASFAPYMALEWMPNNLARILAIHKRLPQSTAIRLALQMASALSALHKWGIVHRDLKPANVLMDSEDPEQAQVRLSDLGLAKVQAARAFIDAGHVSTGGNTFFGTYDYMAPEQWIQSKTADTKADVYSLGVMLFEMLAGRLPFVADEAKDLMGLHLMEPPPMDLLGPHASIELQALVAQMLEKKTLKRLSLDALLQGLATL